MYWLAWILPEAAISPCRLQCWAPQAKPPTGQEHSPTHQQTSGLKTPWTWPCAPEGQNPALPTSGPESALHKCLRQPQPPEGSQKNYSPAACGTETAITESESEVTQSCPALCDPVDCSLPGFSIHGILQARMLGWVAISFSRGSYQPRDRTQVSHIGGRLFNPCLREAPES